MIYDGRYKLNIFHGLKITTPSGEESEIPAGGQLFEQENQFGSRGGEAKPLENQKIKNTLK